MLRAAISAVAPGMDITSIPSLIHAETSLIPGSDIVGVPASEIKAAD